VRVAAAPISAWVPLNAPPPPCTRHAPGAYYVRTQPACKRRANSAAPGGPGIGDRIVQRTTVQ
jgi:hypothetical protein